MICSLCGRYGLSDELDTTDVCPSCEKRISDGEICSHGEVIERDMYCPQCDADSVEPANIDATPDDWETFKEETIQ